MKRGVEQFAMAVRRNIVPIIFAVICVIGIEISGQSWGYVATETVSRMTRNVVLVLSLVFPVMCGMGLNFGIVLGAMAAQIGYILVTHWSIDGITGFMAAGLIATGIAIVFGYLVGNLFNRVKGQEMITGMILGYAAGGAYNIIFIFMVGALIPMTNPEIMLEITGNSGETTYVGLRNTIELHEETKYALDNIWKIDFALFLLLTVGVCLLIGAAVWLYGIKRRGLTAKASVKKTAGFWTAAGAALLVWLLMKAVPPFADIFFTVRIPVVTVCLIGAFCLLAVYIQRTKLGQDIRTVGNNMSVATAAGIHVDKVRRSATVLSMVFAAWGQLIYLQNIGNFQTYSSHENVGTYAVAALLVGGASLESAKIRQVLTGTALFHILFFITPLAATVVLGDAAYGEYFRVFLCYGIIAVSLALYALKKNDKAMKIRKK